VVALALRAAPASTVEPLTLDGLVRNAERVVHGDVASVRVELGRDRRPLTIVEIAPRETLKGAQGMLVLRLPGGEVNGVAMIVHGMPAFRRGEEVVVAATAPHERSGVRVPVGLALGKWSVGRDGIARREVGAIDVARERGRAGPQPRAQEPLDELLRELRAAVAREAKGAT
jgi:hypothetical protein